jgi:hypothetical protein
MGKIYVTSHLPTYLVVKVHRTRFLAFGLSQSPFQGVDVESFQIVLVLFLQKEIGHFWLGNDRMVKPLGNAYEIIIVGIVDRFAAV